MRPDAGCRTRTRAADYALAQPTGIASACIDVDLVDLLVHALDDRHRGHEIDAWLARGWRRCSISRGRDGGFADESAGIPPQDGSVRGYAEPQGLSNTFATWFRWIAIAMIAERLWPGGGTAVPADVGIGYRMSARHDRRRDRSRICTTKCTPTPSRHRARARMAGAPRRSATTPLDEGWQLQPDPFEEGAAPELVRRSTRRRPANGPAHATGEPEGGAPVPVPSCWNCLRPEWLHYEGCAWYARDIAPCGAPAVAMVLRVGAAAGLARVFVGDQFLGLHRGDSTPFCVERPARCGRVRTVADRRGQHALARRRADAAFRLVQLRRPPSRGDAARSAAMFIRAWSVALALGQRLRAPPRGRRAVRSDSTARRRWRSRTSASRPRCRSQPGEGVLESPPRRHCGRRNTRCCTICACASARTKCATVSASAEIAVRGQTSCSMAAASACAASPCMRTISPSAASRPRPIAPHASPTHARWLQFPPPRALSAPRARGRTRRRARLPAVVGNPVYRAIDFADPATRADAENSFAN